MLAQSGVRDLSFRARVIHEFLRRTHWVIGRETLPGGLPLVMFWYIAWLFLKVAWMVSRYPSPANDGVG